MERIKQALEKARRGALGTGGSPLRPPLVPAASDGSVEQLKYTSTRVEELDTHHLERHRIVAFNKNDPRTVSFDLLRTQVLRRMAEKGWRTIAITSPNPGAGKTVVAINLAMGIAHQTDKTAMLVDFDLRRPKVATYLGLAKNVSLNDVFAGDATVQEALVNPGLPRLVVLPTMRRETKPAELLSSPKVQQLIKELRERYPERVVIFDLPPLLSADDALAVLPQIDCVLVVVGNGEVSSSELQDSLRHLPAVNVLGYVLNKGEFNRRAYY